MFRVKNVQALEEVVHVHELFELEVKLVVVQKFMNRQEQ